MTHDDVIELWREHREVHAFARAVEAIAKTREREQCAKALEELPLQWSDQPGIAQAERATILECVQTIRARGNL